MIITSKRKQRVIIMTTTIDMNDIIKHVRNFVDANLRIKYHAITMHKCEHEMISDFIMCEIAIHFDHVMHVDEIQNMFEFMTLCNQNERKYICYSSFQFTSNDREYLIGDGDDTNATRFFNNKLIMWVRSF